MKFSSLARRLTAWYVVVAVSLAVLLAGAVVVAGLLLYARDTNEQIDAVGRQLPDIEARARADRDDWPAAVELLLRRVARPGLTIQAAPLLPGTRALPRNAEYSIVRISEHHAPAPGTVGAGHAAAEYRPFYGNRFGFVAATFLGIHPVRRPFMGGFVAAFADLDRVVTVVDTSLAILLVTGLFAGLVAWLIARYITSQAMRPLYDVTSALIRFAGRDFSAHPIDLAGRSEFDELVRAYNAAATQVKSAFDERAAAEGQMRQFVADAGHELRTPLTIVLGYIDMLKRRAPDDDRSRRIFETIAIEGTRMRTLIDNLVLLARLEGEDIRPTEPFALRTLLVDDVIGPRREIAPQIRFELTIEVEATIIGNRSEIYEAIANVVDNALKYAPGSPIEIRVTAVPGGVEIAISDRGPGVAEADRSAIFDRFYRGSTRGEVEGSGLGLPIARRAVERAGGTLVLRSTNGAGSTFVLRLRADHVAPAAALATPTSSLPA